MQALSDALASEGQTGPASSVHVLAQAAGNRTQVDLSKLIDLGPYGVQDHVAGASDANVNLTAMDVAQGVLSLANQDRQVALDFGANVPGLTSPQAWLAIGERPNNSPWMTVSSDNSVTIATAQARLYIQAQALTGLRRPGRRAFDPAGPCGGWPRPSQARDRYLAQPIRPPPSPRALSVMTERGNGCP